MERRFWTLCRLNHAISPDFVLAMLALSHLRETPLRHPGYAWYPTQRNRQEYHSSAPGFPEGQVLRFLNAF